MKRHVNEIFPKNNIDSEYDGYCLKKKQMFLWSVNLKEKAEIAVAKYFYYFSQSKHVNKKKQTFLIN